LPTIGSRASRRPEATFSTRAWPVGDDFRSADEQADGDDDQGRDDPGGQDGIRDWDTADLKEVGGGLFNAIFGR